MAPIDKKVVKMKIGMIGLGKLGLPSILALESRTRHQVFGFDVSESVMSSVRDRKIDYWEEGVNELLADSNITVTESIEELVAVCDIVFVAVQTPHDPMYEGRTPVPKIRKDFDYSYLETVAREISLTLSLNPTVDPLIVVISTVLPGTMRERILPILRESGREPRFAYNPFFIAMGTTVEDFLNPEFILIGSDSEESITQLASLYSVISSEVIPMDIESAELTKVSYNTFIGFKIVFSNAIAEITQSRGGNPDIVTNALSRASKRLMSPSYMRPGMGDGGGCHPRDQIAMSYLAEKEDLSADIFDFLAKARDAQTKKLADYVLRVSESRSLPICVLGLSYKKNSPLDVGSPARLLEFYLKEASDTLVLAADPWIQGSDAIPESPHVFVVGVMHDLFSDFSFPNGSVIIDPWGFIKNSSSDIEMVYPGRSHIPMEN